MDALDLRRALAWVAAAVVLAALAGWYVLARSGGGGGSDGGVVTIGTVGGASSGDAPARNAAGGSAAARLVVDVAGAVQRPGVYRFATGARVEDALARAGGATSRADLTQINRAAKLEDGRQILVPVRVSRTARAAGASAAGSGAAGAGAAGGATPAVPINLNTATLEQLDTLDGVGPATAQKILDYRSEHNGFGSVEDLANIPGIGEKRLAAMRDKVRV